MTTITFDPAAYKDTTRAQWDQAAGAWHGWGPTLEDWLGEATTLMLDAAGVGTGSAVLDVAAGAGGQSLAAARRAGPSGRVLATDISPVILRYTEAAATAAGITTVQIRTLDAEQLDVEPGAFDAVISRLGLMYLPDLPHALAGMHRALRPGGRVAAVVFSTPDRNGFFSVPVSIARRSAGLGPPAPGQPGPFSLGAPGALEQVLRQAGFVDIGARAVPAPFRLPRATDCLRFLRESAGALHQLLAALSATERDQTWQQIHDELSRFERADGFQGPCELIVAWGTKTRSHIAPDV
ncbi:class I SAM-dependent methyltransferase [Pseudonocardia halophobica]|uniref:Methyltransferase n=1 Tax=Pseudonocardia halophobica TaxID=29401 RepID=A0A9W6P0U2_9PSEU|nr:class I SAM-dependent methyltransferase [Pseudonocardia halophobica]GLL15767.1 methyltransferase [Pseudonocardia halophobica]